MVPPAPGYSASALRRWGSAALLAAAGYEDNDLGDEQGTSGNDDEDGFVWRAGATFTPNARTRLEAGVSHRFFGTGFFLDFERRFRKSVARVSYDETPTTASRLELERDLVVLVDDFGEPVIDPDTGEAFRVPTDTPRQTSDVLIQRRLDGSLVVRGLRTEATVAAFLERREFETGGRGDEKVYGVRSAVTRQLPRGVRAVLDGAWQRTDFDEDDSQQTFWTVGLGFQKQFARNFSASVEVRHSEENSDGENNDYKENRVLVGASYTF